MGNNTLQSIDLNALTKHNWKEIRQGMRGKKIISEKDEDNAFRVNFPEDVLAVFEVILNKQGNEVRVQLEFTVPKKSKEDTKRYRLLPFTKESWTNLSPRLRKELAKTINMLSDHDFRRPFILEKLESIEDQKEVAKNFAQL